MIGWHRLARAEFAALASGLGGAPAVRELSRARLSRHLLLLKFIAGAWPDSVGGRDEGMAALFEAQASAPEPIASLLGEPLVGSWAAHVARRLHGLAATPPTRLRVPPATPPTRLRVPPDSPIPLPVDLGHLGAIAAAAAMLSGLDADLAGYVHNGTLAIPAIGSVRLPLPHHTAVRLAVRSGQLTVMSNGIRVAVPHDPSADGPSWHGLRRLVAAVDGRSIGIALDDLNPYRDAHHLPAAPRLAGAELAGWEDCFARAWTLLARWAPARVIELAAGLRAIVPLADPGTGAARSATVRDAFGSFGLTRPTSAADFAVTMVHEFQHSKLSAVLDLVPLYDAADRTAYYAPWRLDPRPIGGLLQGAYAFLGVADTWRSLRGDAGLRELAEREFAGVREQVRQGLDVLAASGRLTPAGQRFLAGMQSTMHSMMGEQLPASVVRQARAALADNHDAWRQRNGVAGSVRMSMH